MKVIGPVFVWLLLLTVVRSASAQDVWILWGHEEGPEAETSRWQVKVAVPSQSACAKAMEDEIRNAKYAFINSHDVGYKVTDTGRSGWIGTHEERGIAQMDISVAYQCLPDTGDPNRPTRR